jgi:MYXO-CTERM domain-containing protein
MRRPISLAALLGLTFVARASVAQVTEPNGLSVPIDSSPQIQLYTLFSMRGENINWQTDAHTTPSSFSPRCGFTATYVLNQAGSHFGLAWYNETGTAPQATDLHQLVAQNSPVGTMFSGTTITSDPAYTGGTVGFALIGGETHYTNSAYDTQCAICSPVAPWITALMYASTATPDAYYICFEDGTTNAFAFSNDGDFNDDVYFVTGLAACAAGGQPCNTGKPGICGPGLTQCAGGGGTTCQESTPPAATETCNGLDDNCNGQVDEGAVCPPMFVCDKGSCVMACAGEFPCRGGLVCSSDGHCVDPLCASVTCPMGQVCVGGTCKGPCDGVTCPFPDVCRVGACVDPCAGVTCPMGLVCQGGVCIGDCTCQPCTAPQVCNMTSGLCIDPTCAGVTCAAGTHCVSGQCADDCMGAVCPGGQACTGGTCVGAPDGGVAPGSDGGGIVGPAGDGGGLTAPGDGGSAGGLDAGHDAATNWGSSPHSKGCGCRAAGQDAQGAGMAWLGAAAALAGIGLRRRSRQRAR